MSPSSPRWRRLACAVVVFAHPLLAPAAPVISEFLADNESGITDEDGTRQDWIELHNPDATPVNLDGWFLTDSAGALTKWRVPAVTIEPGGFLTVFASSKDRRIPGQTLHTNFSLRAAGEYLALVQPDGVTVAQDFGTQFPPQDADRSFGLAFTRTDLVKSGDSAQYRIPANSTAIPANWTSPAFTPTGWTANAPTGLGFGITVPGMTMTIRARAGGQLNTLADVDALLALPAGNAGIAGEEVTIESVFNVLGNGGDGHYGNNKPAPAFANDDYVVRVTGTLVIPTAGAWTFGINSDDGGRIRIDGTNVMVDDTLHGAADTLGTRTLSAGPHTFDALFFERGGGDEGEFYAGPGSSTVWTSAMRLVGDVANGGLATFTQPPGGTAGGTATVRTNVESVMRNVNASCFLRLPFTVGNPATISGLELATQYNDGFVAWLNGVEIGRRNAPATPVWNSTATATRALEDSLLWEGLNATAARSALTAGTNVLAIQALNTTAADSSFLLDPELTGFAVQTAATPSYFDEATPGLVNSAPSAYGKVADTTFSPKRGLYPNAAVPAVPFPVTISSLTDGAVIRYTTDGSTPTSTTGTVYTGPISITATTVLRAAAFKDGFDPTNVDTHTYLVPDSVLTQSPTGAAPGPGWPAPGTTNGQVMDYGMDPDIVNSTNTAIGGAAQVRSALTAIPSFSLVSDLPAFFSTATGIYVNPGGRGFAWERPCSLELLNDPEGGFQEDCGMRTRGGFSRSGDNPKHAFHLYFRGDYGSGKLTYPLFGPDGIQEFNQFDIRTAQNYSWSFQGDSRNTFLREEFSRVAQLDMGHPGSHVKYAHLYLNGVYWGLFNIDERTEADFCSSYLGGAKDNWDVVKAEQDSGYITGVTDGNTSAWDLLFAKANPLTSPGVYTRRTLTTADYYAMQGLAADGVTRTADPVLLDVDNLIDYMLLTFWMGNLDGATSAFLGDQTANNWFGARDRAGERGFLFFAHDFEHTMLNTAEDRTGPYNRTFANVSDYNTKRTYYNPMFLHADLMDVPLFKRRWADRVQKHLFNDGALSLTKNSARINDLAAVVDSAIIAESARWGDAKTTTPFNRQNWINERNNLLNNFLPQRTATVLNQLRTDGLYPSLAAVTYSQWGGYLPSTTPLSLGAVGATGIYYTVDGSDPQLPDGSLNPAATLYVGGTTSLTDLVPAGASWKYLDPSSDQGSSDIVVGHPSWSTANWKHPAFNDTGAAWKSGIAELGNGDGDETTVINIGPSGTRYPVIYFRKSFTVSNVSEIDQLTLDIRRDDGAIVYINGQEVGRSNLAAGAVGYDYTNGTSVGGADETTFFPVADPRLLPSVLVNGNNVICVEMHNVNAGSSDISFDLRLQARSQQGNQPIVLTPGVHQVQARAVNGGTFSALSDATFLVDAGPATAANLVVSEIMYHPTDPTAEEALAGFNDDSFFEYLELQNIGTQAIDLAGVKFSNGLDFDLTDAATGRLLAAGGRLLVVADAAAFALRYGTGLPVAGEFSGSLNNGGEQLALTGATGAVIRDFAYSDAAPWPEAADGAGASLVLRNPGANPDHSLPESWRASALPGGTPGGSDATGYLAWKAGYGNPADLSDNDSDGLDTFWEYALGGTPGTNDSAKLPVSRTESILTPDGALDFQTIIVSRRVSAGDVDLIPESSLDLDAWSTADLVLEHQAWNADGTETLVFRHLTPMHDDQRRFLRVRGIITP